MDEMSGIDLFGLGKYGLVFQIHPFCWALGYIKYYNATVYFFGPFTVGVEY